MDKYASAFTGGQNGSFLTNHYVVYNNYILDPNEQTNWYGYHQVNTYIARMLFARSGNIQSSFQKFCAYLRSIAEYHQRCETKYITSRFTPDDPVYKLYAKGEYTAAFSLALTRESSLEEIKRQVNQGSLLTNLNQLYNARFETVGPDLLAKLDKMTVTTDKNFIEFDGSFVDFIQQYIDQVAGTDLYEIEAQSLLGAKKDLLNQLFVRLNSSHILSPTSQARLENEYKSYGYSDEDLKELKKRSNVVHDIIKTPKRGTQRSISQICKRLLAGLGRGVGEELANVNVGHNLSKGSISFNTGNWLQKLQTVIEGETEQKVKVRTDVITLDCGEVTIDYDQIAASLPDSIQKNTIEWYNAFLAAVTKMVQGQQDIFELHISAKEYVSKYNLKIIDNAPFDTAGASLNNLGGEFPLNGDSIDGNYFDKLLTLLLNTTKGAIADNPSIIDRLSLNIASAVATWIWSDYGEVMAPSNKIDNVARIHLFDQNGVYYPASMIIFKALEALENNEKLSQANTYVDVRIKQPSTFDSETYLRWKEEGNGLSVVGVDDYNERQQRLEQRWQIVRNAALSEGRLSITFDQERLYKLVGQLGDIANVLNTL